MSTIRRSSFCPPIVIISSSAGLYVLRPFLFPLPRDSSADDSDDDDGDAVSDGVGTQHLNI